MVVGGIEEVQIGKRTTPYLFPVAAQGRAHWAPGFYISRHQSVYIQAGDLPLASTFTGAAMSEELYTHEDEDDDLEILSSERICGNCRFWDRPEAMVVPVYDRNGIRRGELSVCPCTRGAVEADAGVSVTLTAATGRCDNHADEFEPCSDYLDELASPACCGTFGVQPGLDFPETLGSGYA
ncbi:hypothetical protein SAMN02910291_00494 [Desulfovibrio desulfuricans]|uniref:Uncharacterized protein n=2 Tax=Desulfovibrionaceae TaxID=194924 RepID=A0AA94L1H1_DESDE|nr:hypothetical protein SAMN02910291_00494 [Desulfovibrio desulfuricans]SPD36740.1 Hypothetical protein DSVG11_2706 [Desulfovibrio sp. G11]